MNKFALLSPEELEKHLSSFLIRHFSVSAVSSFICNEKGFEKTYIFKQYSLTSSLPHIIGDVYHKTLMAFWKYYKLTRTKMGFDELSMVAHEELAKIGANRYRAYVGITLEESQIEALQKVNKLIQNFYAEIDSYLDEIEEILEVEYTMIEFISINGIDIPIPLKCKSDLIFIDKQGYLCILDHKSVKDFTKEKDVDLKYGNQSIGNTLAGDAWSKKQTEVLKKYPKVAEGIKRFLYYENKIAQNRDGSRQIRQIPIDIEKSRQLYEQVLFEGIWRVVEAVQNPDYVYLMNPFDHNEDSEEMVGFWVKTHLEGYEGFPNLEPHQVELLKKKRQDIRTASLIGIPKNVIKAFSQPKDFISLNPADMENLTPSQRIEHRLATLNYPVKVQHIISGYSCDTYLIAVNAGLKISTIYNYKMDIANALGVESVRIAPSLIKFIDGVSYVSVEVNRNEQNFLYLQNTDIPEGLKFPIGRDNFGHTISWDISNASTPHFMVSGTSGSGKSVTIKNIIEVATQKGVRVSILDPKNEFAEYASKGFEVIQDQQKIEEFMEYAVLEMDEIFRTKGAYGNGQKRLIVFDEAADAYQKQSKQRVSFQEGPRGGLKKNIDVEFRTLQQNTLILAQKARSAGIHLLLGAQRFTSKVFDGDTKANFSTRLCLRVTSMADSRVMLDQEGAEKLKGKGDGLFVSPDVSEPVRIQCFSQK